ncbi:MAG: hypothetical protein KJ002_12620 [Candidatus Dadabacteria bacterium]|nr:hypothetical protein [Candidatus Dadabacteria bacterium]
MRLILFLLISMFFAGTEAESIAIDYEQENPEITYELGPKAYCYNYTFIDGNEIAATLRPSPDEYETTPLGLDILYDNKLNVCKPYGKTLISSLGMNTPSGGLVSYEEPVLTGPQVSFFEDTNPFDSITARQTIFYGGVVPFVAIPDNILDNEDRFFNGESFSVFLYFKTKF